MILAQVIIVVLIIVVIKVGTLKVVIRELLKGKSLTGEPVDGAGNELLLDVLTELVIQLETLLDIGLSILLIVVAGSLRRGEEVEERLGGNSLLDNAGLLGV